MEITEAIENLKLILSALKLGIKCGMTNDAAPMQIETFETILLYVSSHAMFDDLKKEK